MLLLTNKYLLNNVLLLGCVMNISVADSSSKSEFFKRKKQITYSAINSHRFKPLHQTDFYVIPSFRGDKPFGPRYSMKDGGDLKTSATEEKSSQLSSEPTTESPLQVEAEEDEYHAAPDASSHVPDDAIPLSQGQPFYLPMKQDEDEDDKLEQEQSANYYSPADSGPKYEYLYKVQDSGGSNYGHKESRQGPKTWGEYFVHLPDGRLKTVRYWADDSGYHAEVEYVGDAYHPQKLHHHTPEYASEESEKS